jgi:hypothetical protein
LTRLPRKGRKGRFLFYHIGHKGAEEMRTGPAGLPMLCTAVCSVVIPPFQ